MGPNFDQANCMALEDGAPAFWVDKNQNGEKDDVFSNKTVSSLFSYIGRVNYSYADKLLLTGTVRRDGSSKFGLNNNHSIISANALINAELVGAYAHGLSV